MTILVALWSLSTKVPISILNQTEEASDQGINEWTKSFVRQSIVNKVVKFGHIGLNYCQYIQLKVNADVIFHTFSQLLSTICSKWYHHILCGCRGSWSPDVRVCVKFSDSRSNCSSAMQIAHFVVDKQTTEYADYGIKWNAIPALCLQTGMFTIVVWKLQWWMGTSFPQEIFPNPAVHHDRLFTK